MRRILILAAATSLLTSTAAYGQQPDELPPPPPGVAPEAEVVPPAGAQRVAGEHRFYYYPFPYQYDTYGALGFRRYSAHEPYYPPLWHVRGYVPHTWPGHVHPWSFHTYNAPAWYGTWGPELYQHVQYGVYYFGF